jgi:periplasmic protein TonB
MAYVDTYPAIDRRELLRWSFCAAAVLLAHAAVLLALCARPDYAETDAGAPVVMIELAPLSVAPPAPETDVAPGPQQLQAESHERMREETPEEKPPEVERVPDLAPAQNPVVTLPAVPEPPKERAREEAKQEPAEAAPVPTAPPAAVAPALRPASPPPGRVPRPSPAALMSWQRSLVAQLERNKRYPPGAGGVQGTARLAFRIDRRGHLLTSRIVQGSGSAALDEETLALVKRAQPFPPPPADISDDQLSFVVPIRYAASARQ